MNSANTKLGIILNGLQKSLKGRKENYTRKKFTKKGEENHRETFEGISAGATIYKTDKR